MHPKFDPTGVRTHDLQIMTVHFKNVTNAKSAKYEAFTVSLRSTNLMTMAVQVEMTSEKGGMIVIRNNCYESKQ